MLNTSVTWFQQGQKFESVFVVKLSKSEVNTAAQKLNIHTDVVYIKHVFAYYTFKLVPRHL